MNDFPDFTAFGYQIRERLGCNSSGGRATYKALELNTQNWVVVKQFRFATGRGNWSDYRAIEREITVLQALEHPGIPRYLNSFDPGEGLCLVQEYKEARSLAVFRPKEMESIKTIALQLLEILVYLQTRIVPIAHRDLKPENILADDNLQVYLIDFGLATTAQTEAIASISLTGTPGFMPPEQLLNRPLSTAADLYAVGATLICLLSGKSSAEIALLADGQFRIDVSPLLPHLNPAFIAWLQKLLEPEASCRYADAKTAREALKPLALRPPTAIALKAAQWGEQLSTPLALPASATPWELVSPSPGIALVPSNGTVQMTVDTRALPVKTRCDRTILLRADGQPETYSIALEIETAAPTPALEEESAGLLLLLAIAAFAIAGISLNFGVVAGITLLGAGGLLGFFIQADRTSAEEYPLGRSTGKDLQRLAAAAALGWSFGLKKIYLILVRRGMPSIASGWLISSAIGFGTSAGWIAGTGFQNPWLDALLLVAGLPLLVALRYPALKPSPSPENPEL